MNPILEQICRIGIIPVIAIDDAKKAVPLARSLVEGGLPAAEVTFRTCAAEEAMRAIAAEVPEMLLGAGTVLNHEQVDRALAAGAKFIVSPGFNPDTVRYVKSKGGRKDLRFCFQQRDRRGSQSTDRSGTRQEEDPAFQPYPYAGCDHGSCQASPQGNC